VNLLETPSSLVQSRQPIRWSSRSMPPTSFYAAVRALAHPESRLSPVSLETQVAR
jgi:hypothetical protein